MVHDPVRMVVLETETEVVMGERELLVVVV